MLDALVLVGFVFFFVWLFSAPKEPQTKTPVKIHNRHGHRCYVDGLNPAELSVVKLLAENLDHKDYFLFNNLSIPSEHNGSSQIDHIIVSRFGVFVIESKDYSGWIFGHKHRKEWTATYRGRRNRRSSKYPFQNPLLQNYAHVAALSSHLQYVAKHIRSVVVFSDECEFQTERIENVLYQRELVDYIKKFNVPKLKRGELIMAIGHLSYMCQATHIPPDVHISNIENRIAAKVENNP